MSETWFSNIKDKVKIAEKMHCEGLGRAAFPFLVAPLFPDPNAWHWSAH
jgi:hypothetical protein